MARKISNFPASDLLLKILHTPLYWLNFLHFSENKLKIKLILKLINKGKSKIDLDLHNS